jgi:hypothetical protein
VDRKCVKVVPIRHRVVGWDPQSRSPK